MRKKSFIYNFGFLLGSGFIVKLLGLANKVVLVRILGIVGMKVYAMVTPTLLLFITVSEFSFPQSLSKVISERVAKKNYSNRGIIFGSLKYAFFISLSLIILLLVLIKPIVNVWFCNELLFYPLLSIIPLIPLVALTGILKGYFYGHKRMDVTSTSTLIEQITRFIVCICLFFVAKDDVVLVVVLTILGMSLGEFTGLLYMLLMVRKVSTLKITNVRSANITDVVNISLPSTLSRLTFSICNFLEPIVFVYALANLGLKNDVANLLFAVISGYAIPLLVLLSFISYSIDVAVLPLISESKKLNDHKRVNDLIRSSLILNVISGGLITILLYTFSSELMNLLFATTLGSNYVKLMAPFFLFYYFQGILHVALEVYGKANVIFVVNVLLCIVKLVMIYVFGSIASINGYSLAISTVFGVVITAIIYYCMVKKHIGFKIPFHDVVRCVVLLVVSWIFAEFLCKFSINYLVSCVLIGLFYGSIVLFLYRKKDFTSLCGFEK